MEKPLNKTFDMLKALMKRDWIKLIVWLLAVLAYAASGVGKFSALYGTGSAASQAIKRESIFGLFTNPALKGIFGPTAVTKATDYTISAAFGQTMVLLTAIIFSIVSIVYVINRTRKDEDDGIAELFRSFQIGKLANTTAVVIELFVLQFVITLFLASSITAQHAIGMTSFSTNLLYAATIGSQGFMWGIIALFFAQIFSDAGGAKGATFGLFGLLYILRLFTDTQAVNLSWLNPMSWSYLTDVYVKNNWFPIVLTLLFSLILLVLTYLLEINRDVDAGYIGVGSGRATAPRSLLSIEGLVLRQQRTASILSIAGIFVLSVVYGSMIGQISNLMSGNSTYAKMLGMTVGAGTKLLSQQFLSTVFLVVSILVACFAITSLTRMVSEERKNRQEQLYATRLSRIKLYATYVGISWLLAIIAQFVGVFGVWISQVGNKDAFSFAEMMKPGLAWIPATLFILALLAVLSAFVPRWDMVIWVYVGFIFFVGFVGNIIGLPGWVNDLSIFHHIMKATSATILPNTPNFGNIYLILGISLVLAVVSYFGYRNRDLIGG